MLYYIYVPVKNTYQNTYEIYLHYLTMNLSRKLGQLL